MNLVSSGSHEILCDFIGKIRYNSYILYWENEPILSHPLSHPIGFVELNKLCSQNHPLTLVTTPPQIPLVDFDTLTIPPQKILEKKIYPYGIFYTNLPVGTIHLVN